MVISENGTHYGVKCYETGLVYDNLHPYGLPEELWLCDFDGLFPIEPFPLRIPFAI